MTPSVKLVLVLLFASNTMWTGTALAAPKAKLWEFWTAHDPDSTATIDHAPWNAFLQTYLSPHPDGINRVAYAKVSNGDRELLSTYIDDLAALPIRTYRRDEQLAYWINLYNALTVQVVLDDFPVESIRDISSGLFSFGPWRKKRLTIEGESLSLDDIEHRILRPVWKDARVHYAVNCASLGCPNLQPVAFRADNTQELLDVGAREYVNHPRGAQVTRDGLVVSSIYDWFEDDFGGNDRGVIGHLLQYADPELAQQLQSITEVERDRYDWAINSATPVVKTPKRFGS